MLRGDKLSKACPEPVREIVAERNPKTLREPYGASSGTLSVEGGVDGFAQRRRAPLRASRGPQNCYVFPGWRGLGKTEPLCYNVVTKTIFRATAAYNLAPHTSRVQ